MLKLFTLIKTRCPEQSGYGIPFSCKLLDSLLVVNVKVWNCVREVLGNVVHMFSNFAP